MLLRASARLLDLGETNPAPRYVSSVGADVLGGNLWYVVHAVRDSTRGFRVCGRGRVLSRSVPLNDGCAGRGLARRTANSRWIPARDDRLMDRDRSLGHAVAAL